MIREKLISELGSIYEDRRRLERFVTWCEPSELLHDIDLLYQQIEIMIDYEDILLKRLDAIKYKED